MDTDSLLDPLCVDVIDTYTSKWDPVMSPQPPDVGDWFKISFSPDGREISGFLRVLSLAELDYEFREPADESGFDIYEIVPRRL